MKSEAGYKQRKVVYRNLGNGRFADVSDRLGPPVMTPAAGRGAAFADLDNDGDTDVVVNNMHDSAGSLPAGLPAGRAVADAEARRACSRIAAPSARACGWSAGGGAQVQEVRGGGSYYSQNDLRVHFGLGESSTDRARGGPVAQRARGAVGRAGYRSDRDAEGGRARGARQ